MSEDISFQPKTPPRPGTVYVSHSLMKAMRYAAKREGGTPEDLLERVMSAYLSGHHVDIMLWLSQREVEEKNFVKSLEVELIKKP